MHELNDEVRRRWPQIEDPLTGPIAAWLTIAPCLNTSGACSGPWSALHPAMPLWRAR